MTNPNIIVSQARLAVGDTKLATKTLSAMLPMGLLVADIRMWNVCFQINTVRGSVQRRCRELWEGKP